jgi:hypothetical protein
MSFRRRRRYQIEGHEFTLYTPRAGDILLTTAEVDYTGWQNFQNQWQERFGRCCPFTVVHLPDYTLIAGKAQKRIVLVWNEKRERWEMDETNYYGGR